ncbi:retinal pigment epithelial membrane protein-domain-containing protein [Mycotypha africana]|uniref:retinal pigment epithelial membrane protein-domain-containing protein n=1 Tax=Mycotypha africana TaxID=64632 RepID=UPI0023016EE2|nr:retinal pigment epithelial membrane protein-domain-containing protein [Mycotypha africana]KAI8982015.1 retinal pigment epithelial membrane protein-domain-containing protein [Mycotypha africana]
MTEKALIDTDIEETPTDKLVETSSPDELDQLVANTSTGSKHAKEVKAESAKEESKLSTAVPVHEGELDNDKHHSSEEPNERKGVRDEVKTEETLTKKPTEEDNEDDAFDLHSDQKKHLLSSLSLEDYHSNDPWAAQPEEDSLLRSDQDQMVEEDNTVATTIVYDVIDNADETTPETTKVSTKSVATPAPGSAEHEQNLDQDTSAVKGFQNFQDSDKIDDLNVKGQLPQWLAGEYYTIGPCTYDIKYTRKVEMEGEIQNVSALFTFGHWFDALPLVNRFDLNGQRNTITYRNRSTSKRIVEKIRDHHGYAPQHPAGLFMSETNQTKLAKLLGSSIKQSKPDAIPCGQRVLPSIPGLEGRLFALNFANHIQELDPSDLKPTRSLTWNEMNPKLKGTACPNGQYDSRTGEYINFSMEVGYQSVKYHFFSVSDRHPNKATLIASVTAPMAFVNTFSITSKYIIFVICPMYANAGGMKFTWNESIMDSFSFRHDEPALFYVISREKHEVIATYRSDAFFTFHHINAFEVEDHIMLDLICYADDTIARQLTTEFLRHPEKMNPSRLVPSEVRRYVLANVEEENINYLTNNSLIPTKNSVTSRLFGMFGGGGGGNKKAESSSSPAAVNKSYAWMPIATYDKRIPPSIELPQINPNYAKYKYTFMYGLGFSAASSLKEGAIWDSIVKTNMETKQIVASWHQQGCYPSEAVFVPRPAIGPEDQVGEDEGVLLSLVLNSAKATSFLLVLDANTLEVLATADLERLVPLSFAHGACRLLRSD